MALGDHLYVERMGGLYSHHAIDCGDGTVIHYWPDAAAFGSSVQRTTLEEFAEGGRVLILPYASCDPAETVVARAFNSLGARGFDPLTSNCEHFVVWCKTGAGESSQVRSAESFIRGGPGAAAVALLFAPVLVPAALFAALVGAVWGAADGDGRGGRRR